MNRTIWMTRLLLAACLVLLGACGGPIELRQAQDLYNRGVEQENRAGLQAWYAGITPATETQPPRSLSETPRTYYAACLQTLGSVDDGALARDNLLPTKRLLEALCLWRLGRYVEARSAADAAAQAASSDNAPRDRIIATALPGFIKIDEARAMVEDAAGRNGSEREAAATRVHDMLLEGDDCAQAIISRARRLDGAGDDLAIVLTWYELDVYHAWWLACERLLAEDIDDDLKCDIDALLDEMERLKGGATTAAMLRTTLPDRDCN